ncbi:MAG: phytoene/squalene synthase family protein [Candidatus Omnitrophica bacterium]|nr:phytoene/squalene synthase family protein [Candidatus Omnitrophota bacterium]
MGKVIDQGFKEAEKLTKKHAKTFYFASKFLGLEKRRAAYSIYAICRISDDSVDNANGGLKKLSRIEEKINSAYGLDCSREALLLAFKQTVDKYNIPKNYFDQLIKGMHLDLEKKSYADFKQLYDYCYKVAGVVGLIMLEVFGYRDNKAKQPAVDLGIAMQLTNILRDVKEDLGLGRIYLPQDELKSFGLSQEDLSSEKISDKFITFIKYQIRRARNYYQLADEGIKMITDKRSRFVVCAMSKVYGAILDQIEKNNYDLFFQRASVSRLGKLGLLAKVIIEGKYR